MLQELGGWASPVMVRRYAHHTTAHLAAHVDAFGTRFRLSKETGDDMAAQDNGGGKQDA